MVLTTREKLLVVYDAILRLSDDKNHSGLHMPKVGMCSALYSSICSAFNPFPTFESLAEVHRLVWNMLEPFKPLKPVPLHRGMYWYNFDNDGMSQRIITLLELADSLEKKLKNQKR